MLANQWKQNAFDVMNNIEATQMEQIKKVAEVMADCIQSGHLVHTFGCGHSNLPIEEMYPRIGGIVGFHPLCELPLTFFTHIVGEMGINQFLWLERQEGYAQQIMSSWRFEEGDLLWLFTHTGINAVVIDMANEAHKRGMKVIVCGSAKETGNKVPRHSGGKNVFQIADYVVDTCCPLQDASVTLKNHFDKIGPLSTMASVTCVWMIITTVCEILADRGVHLHINPSHNVPGDTTAHERLEEAIEAYRLSVRRCQ